MKYKNYYKILDLKGPKVTEDEIKIAYRKLAKKYHPDINPGDTIAQEKFKNINEAYEILGSKDKKKRYNIRYYMHAMQNGIDLSSLKDTFNKAGTSDFIKIFIGDREEQEKPFSMGSIKEKLDVDISLTVTLEEAFNGATKKIRFKPLGEDEKIVTVKIPRGVTTGTVIKLSGEGNKSNFDNKKGDVLLNISVQDDQQYLLKNNNLYKDITISNLDAVLGTEISIDSLDAKYKLKIPEGTQQGAELVIKDAGFINRNGLRGNLVAKINIEIPQALSDKEKQLYNEIRKLNKKR